MRGRWLRVASLVGLGAVLALAAGPLVGALLILVTTRHWRCSTGRGVVYALAMPFVALTTAYVYFDARARLELEPRRRTVRAPGRVPVHPRRACLKIALDKSPSDRQSA